MSVVEEKSGYGAPLGFIERVDIDREAFPAKKGRALIPGLQAAIDVLRSLPLVQRVVGGEPGKRRRIVHAHFDKPTMISNVCGGEVRATGPLLLQDVDLDRIESTGNVILIRSRAKHIKSGGAIYLHDSAVTDSWDYVTGWLYSFSRYFRTDKPGCELKGMQEKNDIESSFSSMELKGARVRGAVYFRKANDPDFSGVLTLSDGGTVGDPERVNGSICTGEGKDRKDIKAELIEAQRKTRAAAAERLARAPAAVPAEPKKRNCSRCYWVMAGVVACAAVVFAPRVWNYFYPQPEDPQQWNFWPFN